jgi:hypothetical protein
VHYRILAFGYALDFVFNPNGLISFVDAASSLVDTYCALAGFKDRIGEAKADACPSMVNDKDNLYNMCSYLRARVIDPAVTALKGFFVPMPLGILVHVNLFSVLLEGVEALFGVYERLEVICSEFKIARGLAKCIVDHKRLSVVWETELVVSRVCFTMSMDLVIEILPTQMLLDMKDSCPVTIANCELLSRYLTKKVSWWFNLDSFMHFPKLLLTKSWHLYATFHNCRLLQSAISPCWLITKNQ